MPSLKSYITLQLTYSSTCISLPTIHTHMYGHTLGTHQELAEQEGDAVRASSLAQQLEEIEERAEELDKQRTKGLSAIRSVAQINVHCHKFVVSVSTSSYTFCLAVLFICGKQYILLT